MKKYNSKYIIILIFSIIAVLDIDAAHIIGGDVTYECVLIDSANLESTFEITLSLYRDSRGGGAQFDENARFGLFQQRGLVWDYISTYNVALLSKEDITSNSDPCVIIPPNIGVEKGVYKFNVTVAWSDQTYKIAYQRCCRNNTINNITLPGETGAAFEIDILPFAQRSCNNSPTFDAFPPIVICADVNQYIDQSATDAEGDQLFYEFCTPKAAGGTDGATTPGDPNSCTGVMPNPLICRPPFAEVIFNLPVYSFDNPLGTASGINIDATTGLITGRPKVIGQYVVGVCVKEFRGGQLIGEIRRDFQFNVSECEIAVLADILPDDPLAELVSVQQQTFEIKSCGANTLRIENMSIDESNIDGYLWEMDINGQTVSQTTKDAVFDFPGLGTYFGKMIVNPGSESCSDTAFLKVDVFPAINSAFTFAYDTCVSGPVTFTDQSSTGATSLVRWEWSFGDGNQSDNQNPNHQYERPGTKSVILEVEDDNECVSTIEKEILWAPAPDIIVVEPSQFIGCKPANIFFNNLSTPIDDSYDIRWLFGDGGESDVISPSYIYTEEGFYDVKLEITSPLGCYAERLYPQLIQIKRKPTADYTYSPEQPSSFRREVDFFDESIDVVNWFWNFDNQGASFDKNPTYTFPDTGIYNVTLVVINEEGCPDTISQLIDVEPLVTLHFPNAFTPNNDGLNDSFRGKGLTAGITDYSMQIYNRWGALIFESTDPSEGWNGEHKNDGTLSPQGIYGYVVSYRGPRGLPKSEKGQISLIR